MMRLEMASRRPVPPFLRDPDGTYLPDAEAALSYADHTIRELRKKSVYEDDLSLTGEVPRSPAT
jgi:hypothetical protein